MNVKKNPGITIQDIRLLRANLSVGNMDAKSDYSLRLTHLDREEHDEGKSLVVIAGFDLMHGIENPRINFDCTFAAVYERHGEDSMTWGKFSTPLALAHIVPYLREFVSNMTNRMPVPALVFSPLNTHMMVADYEKRQTEKADEPSAQPSQLAEPLE